MSDAEPDQNELQASLRRTRTFVYNLCWQSSTADHDGHFTAESSQGRLKWTTFRLEVVIAECANLIGKHGALDSAQLQCQARACWLLMLQLTEYSSKTTPFSIQHASVNSWPNNTNLVQTWNSIRNGWLGMVNVDQTPPVRNRFMKRLWLQPKYDREFSAWLITFEPFCKLPMKYRYSYVPARFRAFHFPNVTYSSFDLEKQAE